MRRCDQREWRDMPITHTGIAGRGAGVADMAYAIVSGRAHRANGEMAFHVLDIMQSIHESSDTDKILTLTSTCERPAPLPLSLMDGVL